ncbi:hypothetical protein VULLAG_LOCUS3320 [Vulpes lagopus]
MGVLSPCVADAQSFESFAELSSCVLPSTSVPIPRNARAFHRSPAQKREMLGVRSSKLMLQATPTAALGCKFGS